MSILHDPKTGVFHLTNGTISYVLQVFNTHYPVHLYWGKALIQFNPENFLKLQQKAYHEYREILDVLPLEYPAYGSTDFRTPAYQVQLSNGSTITDLRYKTHTIYPGKPSLPGLPSTYVENAEEADTLELILWDAVAEMEVVLYYTIYRDYNAITRSVRFSNQGTLDLQILRALSMNIDFFPHNFDWLHLHGAWGRERYIERLPLCTGLQCIESRRGNSSHQQNPFIALLEENATEDDGQVFGFSLVYSGNFLAQIEMDQVKMVRVNMGINPFDFSWLLKPGECFQTPEVVMVYSDEGLNGMSQTYHGLYRSRLCRGKYRDSERPVLINNWEATYFQFTTEKLLEIADEAKNLGIELFVLDDGWFGKRDDDSCSLGDWFVNQEKLPGGLQHLARELKSRQLDLGLWFEPEMVSPDSDLYREHPDWCLHVPDRKRSEWRRQLILDFSRSEVREEIFKRVSSILDEVPIRYVKWDMNRSMTEIGSAVLPPERQRETAHRYILGLYDFMEKLTQRFPDILFESCAGGGGRFDPGILYYMPQTWTSDNTDAVSRLRIQYGTSIVYPLISMGAHVSTVPNHQVSRTTSLEMRGNVAMWGNLGYELDLTKLTETEKEIMIKQVEYYRKIQPLVRNGKFFRLRSPFTSNIASWMLVSPDQKEVLVLWAHMMAPVHRTFEKLKLRGLHPGFQYKKEDENTVFSGEELLNYGIQIPEMPGDFQSLVWHFTAMEE